MKMKIVSLFTYTRAVSNLYRFLSFSVEQKKNNERTMKYVFFVEIFWGELSVKCFKSCIMFL